MSNKFLTIIDLASHGSHGNWEPQRVCFVVKAGEIDIISAGNPVPDVYFQFLR